LIEGDPLGPLLFSSTVMFLVKRIKSEFNCWYMDEGTLGGNVDTSLKDFNLMVPDALSLGAPIGGMQSVD
jgi:hypothetical protein